MVEDLSQADINKIMDRVEVAMERGMKRVVFDLLHVDMEEKSSIREFHHDLEHLRTHRIGTQDAVKIAKKTAIGVVITGFLAVLASGFKQWFMGG